MSILKYILFAMICLPVIIILWMVAIGLLTLISFPLVIKGALEAVHAEVLG